MKIDMPPIDENPSDADVHFPDDQINRYNLETMGITDGRIISLLIRDNRAEIIAGLYGWTWAALVRSAIYGFAKNIVNVVMGRR